MEPAAQAPETLPTKGARIAFWRAGTAGWSFHDWFEGRGPRGCLMDMVDGASNQTEARIGKRRRSGRRRASCASGSRNTACLGPVYRLEERLQTKTYAGRAVAGSRAGHAVWADVREAGDPDHSRQFTGSQGQSGSTGCTRIA